MTEDQIVGEAALHAFLDNELDHEANTEVELWLKQNPEYIKELSIWQSQKDKLKEVYDPIAKEKIPKAIQTALNRSTPNAKKFSWKTLAASLIFLTLGTMLGFYINQSPLKKKWPKFAYAAISSHIVFAQDLTRPVEFAEPQKNYLLAWIKYRTGKQITPPELSTTGFKLLGGRVLAYANKPAALFMYENVQGKRVTLFVAQNYISQNRPPTFWSNDKINCYYWYKDNLNFAITSDISQEKLQEITKKAQGHFKNI